MRGLVYTILTSFLLLFIACNAMDKTALEGRWAVELEGCQDTVFVINNDTIVAPEFRFYNDSVYMETWQNGIKTKSENMGIYYIRDEQFVFVDRYGNKKITRFEIKDDVLFIRDINDSSKVLMRLVRIKNN